MRDSKLPKTIAIGSDHGGFAMKGDLIQYLKSTGYQVQDCGAFSTAAVDYPQYAHLVAKKVASGEADRGIVIDGAGIGSAMSANKIPGVLAANCYDLSTARNAREHNRANVLTLGAGLVGASLARQITEIFLTQPCTEDRHIRRVNMIEQISGEYTDLPVSQPSIETQVKESELEQLSSTDMDRIAERVAQMILSSQQKSEISHPDHCGTDMICTCGVCMDRRPETIRQFLDLGVNRIGYHDATGGECVPQDIAQCIDHTVLKPDATEDDIRRICAEAREFEFASVCISPSYVKLAAGELAGTQVKVCTVVGFPSGAHVPEIKAMETRQAIRDGAEEIDMVINIGALKTGNDELVYRDIRAVCEACEDGSAVSKVIIEAALLTDDEKVRACQLSLRAKANYVKTSTGFGPHGATVEDVALMSQVVRDAGLGVKAAGGISSWDDAKKMISAGATRLGASAGIKILRESGKITMSN